MQPQQHVHVRSETTPFWQIILIFNTEKRVFWFNKHWSLRSLLECMCRPTMTPSHLVFTTDLLNHVDGFFSSKNKIWMTSFLIASSPWFPPEGQRHQTQSCCNHAPSLILLKYFKRVESWTYHLSGSNCNEECEPNLVRLPPASMGVLNPLGEAACSGGRQRSWTGSRYCSTSSHLTSFK